MKIVQYALFICALKFAWNHWNP